MHGATRATMGTCQPRKRQTACMFALMQGNLGHFPSFSIYRGRPLNKGAWVCKSSAACVHAASLWIWARNPTASEGVSGLCAPWFPALPTPGFPKSRS